MSILIISILRRICLKHAVVKSWDVSYVKSSSLIPVISATSPRWTIQVWSTSWSRSHREPNVPERWSLPVEHCIELVCIVPTCFSEYLGLLMYHTVAGVCFCKRIFLEQSSLLVPMSGVSLVHHNWLVFEAERPAQLEYPDLMKSLCCSGSSSHHLHNAMAHWVKKCLFVYWLSRKKKTKVEKIRRYLIIDRILLVSDA